MKTFSSKERIPNKFTGTCKTVDDGILHWYKEGQLHRIDGPAIIQKGWRKIWYQHNHIHRLDGAAVEWDDGHKTWYVHGTNYTEEQHKNHPLVIKLKLKMIQEF